MAEHLSQLAGALTAEEQKLLACVHCGLCLEACPTYVHTGDENDSPRGRIYLMRAVEESRLPLDSAAFSRHIDRCLGCRACESACPAGVEYGQLLEAARADIYRAGRPRGWTGRALHFVLRHIWLHPSRLRLAFGLARAMRDGGVPRLLIRTRLARLLPSRLEFALALLDSSADNSSRGDKDEASAYETQRVVQRRRRSGESPTHTSDARISERSSAQRALALLFTGCVMDGLFARVNRATARVLEANDCQARAPHGQVCCGALHAHAGDLEGARQLARRNIEAFEEERDAPVITNAGGCGAMLISYAQLLADDKEYAGRARAFSVRVRDVSQQLAAKGIREGAAIGEATITYDASCHLLHGQRATEAPLVLLGAIPRLNFVPLEGSEVCCGGAGVYNLLETELASRVLDEKLAHIKQSGAQTLATGNPGCHMQIGAGAQLKGLRVRVCHPVELLDESYRRAGFYQVDSR